MFLLVCWFCFGHFWGFCFCLVSCLLSVYERALFSRQFWCFFELFWLKVVWFCFPQVDALMLCALALATYPNPVASGEECQACPLAVRSDARTQDFPQRTGDQTQVQVVEPSVWCQEVDTCSTRGLVLRHSLCYRLHLQQVCEICGLVTRLCRCCC